MTEHARTAARLRIVDDPCACVAPPSPELKDRITSQLEQLRTSAGDDPVGRLLSLRQQPKRLGLDDGTIIPPEEFPLGTPALVVSRAAADRSPLRGAVRVIVVMVDFSDKQMSATQQHVHDLFFSTGVLPHGSVKEYYAEVSNHLVDIQGDVVGPYRMPHPLSYYANGSSGLGAAPNGATLAADALTAADPHVNFAPYDNDGNGYVDAFIVMHAGQGAEVTGSHGDIWSHKSTLAGGARSVDGTKVYGYLTIPEDAKIGVSCHELGHLLWGWPDFYDTDYSSEGIGNWCLMAGGTWNGGGDVPAHPSAWCKVNQGWATTTVVTHNGPQTIPDVKTSHNVLRLWKDGASGSEYFLLENRQQTGYDADLPGGGLLLWHCDDSQTSNTNENHYWVGLVQADGRRDLELNHNRGDAGDPFPGSGGVTSVTASTTPNTKSYAGQDTCVAVTAISAAGPSMTATIQVSCKSVGKDLKDLKEHRKEAKELAKDAKDLKDHQKDGKELRKDLIDGKHQRKEVYEKDLSREKRFEKPAADKGAGLDKGFDRPGGGGDLGGGGLQGGAGAGSATEALLAELLDRMAALEAEVGGQAQAFIGADLRPDLSQGAYQGSADADVIARMEQGDAAAKRQYDKGPES